MSPRANPFVKAEPASVEATHEEAVLHDALLGQRLMESGPSDPQSLPITPSDVESDPWPKVQISRDSVTPITVMGLHGGAGTSTMATLLGAGALDHGRTWPVPPEGASLGVVAVCRSHWRGLEAADVFTMQWAAGLLTESTLLGLVIVDDGPTLSDGQRKAMRRLLKRTPRGIHLPWVEAWRHVSPDAGRTPGRITRIVRQLHSAAASL